MKVSVVILNWNGCDMLRTFLPSVIRYSKSEEVEVCVADNGSTDASVEMLREEFPCVRIIVLDQNHGFNTCKRLQRKKAKKRVALSCWSYKT